MSLKDYEELYSDTIKKIIKNGDISTITTKYIRKKVEELKNIQFHMKDKKRINELIGLIYDKVTSEIETRNSDSEMHDVEYTKSNTTKKRGDSSNNGNSRSSSRNSHKQKDDYASSLAGSVSPALSDLSDDIVPRHTNESKITKLVSSDDQDSDIDSDVFETVEEARSNKTSKKRKTNTKSKTTTKKKRVDSTTKKPSNTGFNAPWILSKPLADLLGSNEMSRAQVVKHLWEYIKTNELQDPSDKRFIMCDKRLKNIFGMDRVQGFSMNKLLNDHLTKLDGTKCSKKKVEDGTVENKKKTTSTTSTAAKKRTSIDRSVKKKTKSKKASDDPNHKKRAAPNNGFNKPMLLSAPLSAFLNNAVELSRPQVVKQIWDYIKANELQDPADKRYIRCDDKLYSIFKVKRVHMFQMNRLLVEHLKSKDDIVGFKEEEEAGAEADDEGGEQDLKKKMMKRKVKAEEMLDSLNNSSASPNHTLVMSSSSSQNSTTKLKSTTLSSSSSPSLSRKRQTPTQRSPATITSPLTAEKILQSYTGDVEEFDLNETDDGSTTKNDELYLTDTSADDNF